MHFVAWTWTYSQQTLVQNQEEFNALAVIDVVTRTLIFVT